MPTISITTESGAHGEYAGTHNNEHLALLPVSHGPNYLPGDAVDFTPLEPHEKHAALTAAEQHDITVSKALPFYREDTIGTVKARLISKARSLRTSRAKYELGMAIVSEIPKYPGVKNMLKRGQIAQTAAAINKLAVADGRGVFHSPHEARLHTDEYIAKLRLGPDQELATILHTALVASAPEMASRRIPAERSRSIATLKALLGNERKSSSTLSRAEHRQRAVAYYSSLMYLHNCKVEQSLMHQAGRRHFTSEVPLHKLASCTVLTLSRCFGAHKG